MCAYTHIYVFTQILTNTHTQTNTYIHKDTYLQICSSMASALPTYYKSIVHAHTRTPTPTHPQTQIHTFIHMFFEPVDLRRRRRPYHKSVVFLCRIEPCTHTLRGGDTHTYTHHNGSATWSSAPTANRYAHKHTHTHTHARTHTRPSSPSHTYTRNTKHAYISTIF